MKKNGFTLVEMLIVIGIIAILVAASLASFGKMMKSADKAKGQELVNNAATALTALYEADGVWPLSIRGEGGKGVGQLDEKAARVLGKRSLMSITMVDGKPAGKDKFGILTPWGAKAMDRKGGDAELTTPVNGSSTIQDHIVYYAVDLDGDGIIKDVDVGGEAIDIRATAAVWSIGKSGGNGGKPWGYSQGLKHDDIYSWTYGQTQYTK